MVQPTGHVPDLSHPLKVSGFTHLGLQGLTWLSSRPPSAEAVQTAANLGGVVERLT
jgi:hypothetical protein